jgi:zinc/manganese transport system permease protein
MSDTVSILYLPLLACLLLSGIHGYFGLRSLQRKAILLDLSLAQIAALGSMVAVLFGRDLREVASSFWSFGSTLVAAAIFAFAPARRERRIPEEAIIGIAYVVTAAAAIVAMSRSASGPEDLEAMLIGNALSISSTEVERMAALYATVGAFHFAFRKRFRALAVWPPAESGGGRSGRLWDFLFYASFGAVVASSVGRVGVLVTVAYLVVPAAAARLFSGSVAARLVIAWTVGALVSAVGILLAFKADLPAGATIVCVFGIALALLSLLRIGRGGKRAKSG